MIKPSPFYSLHKAYSSTTLNNKPSLSNLDDILTRTFKNSSSKISLKQTINNKRQKSQAPVMKSTIKTHKSVNSMTIQPLKKR